VKRVNLIEKIKFEGNDAIYKYTGNVEVAEDKRLSFLQAVLISLAPVYISFWLFFFLWDQILNPNLEIWLCFVYIFIMFSIILAAAPSIADIANIPKAFTNDICYSMYQIFLLILSIILLLVLVAEYNLSYFHEIVHYILIMVFYYFFKYSFRGFVKLTHIIHLKKDLLVSQTINQKLKNKKNTRQRHKLLNPRKLEYEEAHW